MALQGVFSKRLSSLNFLFRNSPLFRSAVWVLALFVVFLSSTILFYIIDGRDKEAKAFESATHETARRLKSIQSKLSFIDKRLMHAHSTDLKITILQDRYALHTGKQSAPNVLGIYIQNDLLDQKAIGPLGSVKLDVMPPVSFYEHVLNSQKKIGLFIEGGKAYFVFPRRKAISESGVPEFLLLSMDVAEFLPEGVSALKRGEASKIFQVVKYNSQFYFTPRHPLSLRDYLNQYLGPLLWVFILVLVFFAFGYFDRRFTRERAIQIYSDEMTSLKDLNSAQQKELNRHAKSLEKQYAKIEAMNTSVRSRKVIQTSYESRISLVRERFEKKLKILSDDLEQLVYDDPALQNLSEISSTACKDLSMLSFNEPLKLNRTHIDVEKELGLIKDTFSQELNEKEISYECLVEPVADHIQGDLDTVRLILIAAFKVALDRLGAQGELSIHVKPSETHSKMIEVDMMDNGYHYEGARVASLSAKRPPQNSLFDMSWLSAKRLLETYGGHILKQENAAHDNVISLAIPMDIKAATTARMAENVVSLFKV